MGDDEEGGGDQDVDSGGEGLGVALIRHSTHRLLVQCTQKTYTLRSTTLKHYLTATSRRNGSLLYLKKR